jgi:hypothetical protein
MEVIGMNQTRYLISWEFNYMAYWCTRKLGMNWVPQSHVLKPSLSVLHHVAIFGICAFLNVIKLNWSH